jgi:periplasmic divalent cation tolerance protein
MTDKIVVFTTCSTIEEAEQIARKLVDARLAACVSVTPAVRSFYRWKGAVARLVRPLAPRAGKGAHL